MLGFAVVAYLAGTVAIGLWASRRVHGAKDFMVAGRSLPFYMNFACVFATWFGAETVLSVSATFTRDGLSGISGDPFGASMCLILVALFFAKAFYRMDLLTIGDFFRKRYGKIVEVFTATVITLSYLTWTSAQITALGLVLHVLADAAIGLDALPLNTAIMIGAAIVVIYTIFGGMWSVALTDLIQTTVIIIGLIVIAFFLADRAGGFANVVQHASDAGKLRLFPTGGTKEWFAFIAAFLTLGLGSIPQQDVFQRVTSAKDEQTAIRGTLFGGIFYFVFAFVPMFIAYCAIVIDPSFTALFGSEDPRAIQRILPDLILQKTPFWIQALFFGSLLSAILSTASGTLLAPSSLFTENVIRPFFPALTDEGLLKVLRISLLVFAIGATGNAVSSDLTMYEMVENAYTVTLVGAVVPLTAGIYWKRSSTQGALTSIAAGIATWLTCQWLYGEEAIVPAPLYGLVGSFIGMLIGSLAPQLISTPPPIDISKPLPPSYASTHHGH
ncbi:MAG: sodium:solute symporter family protein [Planctomycetaceae bacterium]